MIKRVALALCFLPMCLWAWPQSGVPADGKPQPLKWIEVMPGIWSASIGHPDEWNMGKAAGARPRRDALAALGEPEFPLDQSEITAIVRDGRTYLRFPLDSTEAIYGLGLQFHTVNQRGRIMRLHEDHYHREDDGRTHVPAPFYVSSKGYGVLIDAARYIDVYAGTSVRRDSRHLPVVKNRNTDPDWTPNPYSDNIDILVPAAGAELLIFGGPTPMNAVQRYNLYNGGGCLPPKWGLGFWHRTPLAYSAGDVEREVAEFKAHRFPLSVIGLEPGWQSSSYPCTYAWDTVRFSRPGAFLDSMMAADIRVNLWIDPYIAPKSPLYPALGPYSASHLVWNGLVPDYTLDQTRQILTGYFRDSIIAGGKVSGFKLDENDGVDRWLWPDVALFPSGLSAEQQRQLYGLLQMNLFAGIYHQLNIRTYGLVRGSNAGASNLPFAMYNDNSELSDFITAMGNGSFMGVLWTAEVRSAKTPEEWLRRMQTASFSPLAQLNAWEDSTKPWTFPSVEKQVNEVVRLRMRLLPYIYTAFADYALEGKPPFRSLHLEKGMELAPAIRDEYLIGDDLLVAPVQAGQDQRRVILPPGKWYDFYTGALAGEGSIVARPGLDHIPLYVKDGAILPLQSDPDVRADAKTDVELRYYGEKSGHYSLFDDDGLTYNYEQGKYIRIQFRVEKDGKGKFRTAVSQPKGARSWSYGNFSWKFMTEPSHSTPQ